MEVIDVGVRLQVMRDLTSEMRDLILEVGPDLKLEVGSPQTPPGSP